jgi:hypothetical protein
MPRPAREVWNVCGLRMGTSVAQANLDFRSCPDHQADYAMGQIGEQCSAVRSARPKPTPAAVQRTLLQIVSSIAMGTQRGLCPRTQIAHTGFSARSSVRIAVKPAALIARSIISAMAKASARVGFLCRG